ncbi:hypothetical protein GCM10020358_76680 [Amorphoplanes nipponensis]|uniref:Secreted protein n=1 Tax=Actinoplanes nipponensis TaxID=135950 RepID=A0A919MLX4_9ACTN|nr:hypothetical protein [Actinoplanes nipponensis]GIE49971.1 hypothetical protein Ani05nite_35050 [Actinoplanes nipponensis]
MRKLLVSAALAAALLVTGAGQAWAAPPDPVPGDGWSVADGHLTWRSDRRIPIGDAAVEFYAGDRRLGRPQAAPDDRTFRLPLEHADGLRDLQVRAGGRRLDATPPPSARRRAATAPAPQPQPLPPNKVDPGVKGPYRTVSGEYALAGVKLPDFPQPVEMRGVVVAPRGAPGKRPIALFLHGRHYTCFNGADEDAVTGDWPCRKGTVPVPSHRGYLQAQQLLASQGYITVSISANGVNGQDRNADDGGAQARSSLVRLHLARWADWAGAGRAGAPAIVRSAPRADLSRVLLMGHSRGGEGVSRAAMDSLTPPPAAQDGYHGKVRWTIRGLLLIGPTIFGQNPVPDVPSATILPGCDGDVADLQGQIFVDGTRGVSRGRALHSALYVIGANHNFFNTEWTPGQSAAPSFDDFSSEQADPVCSPGTATRLTARQEQAVGATYIAAAARLFAGGDDRVRPLLDGTGVRARSADPVRVLSHAIGAGRTPAVLPDRSVKVTGGRLCEQVTDDAARACLTSDSWFSPSPHFVPFGFPREPGRYAVDMVWSGPGKPVTLRPGRPVSLAGARELALRLVVPPNTTGNRFGVAVTDPAGHRTELGEVSLNGLPGTANTTAHWGQEVRVPLKRLRGPVATLQLTPRSAGGEAWLIDAWGWRPGSPAVRPVSLPRVDIGELKVVEGDSGSRTYQVPVKVTGRGAGQVRLFLTGEDSVETRSWLATIRPGARTIRVPVEVTGDKLYGAGEQTVLAAKSVRGTVIGDYQGGVLVTDDDPAPTITVEPVRDRVAEGGTLSWRIRLSAPAETWIWVEGGVRPPAGGAELSSTDVDPVWFTEQTGEEPLPSRPLSETALAPWTGVQPGDVTGELTIPTVVDSVDEPDELVRLELAVAGWGDEDPPELGPVTGTVTD